MIGQYYQQEDYTAVDLLEGDYYAKIIDAKEETAKTSGNLMAVITLSLKETPIQFKYRVVENEYFNKNMTRLFDCFKIPRGDFNMRGWIGKFGVVHIAKGKPNDSGYSFLEVKSLVIPAGKTQAAPQRQTAPAKHSYRQTAQQPAAQYRPAQSAQRQFEDNYDRQESQYQEGMPFPEDIPF